MNEENKINYYSVLPATVRYDPDLKPSEKLLYSEVTALANRNGYCFAKNKYFADLYDVTNGTVSKWFSHLQKLGYINIEIIRNEKQEIIARHIYIVDSPYDKKRPYTYGQKELYSMVKNGKDNNIKYNIDDLFILIINNSNKISNEFYSNLKRLEFIYPRKIINTMEQTNLIKLKEIIYTLFLIYNSNFKSIMCKFDREILVNLYLTCKNHNSDDFFNYYRQAIINKYTNTS